MTAWQAFPRSIGVVQSPVWRWVAAAIAVGVVLGALGPFGSYANGGLLVRCGYWVAAMLVAQVLYGAALRVVLRIAPLRSRARWPLLVVAVLLVSVPQALVTRALAFGLWPALARYGPDRLVWFGQTATIGLIATAAVAFVLWRGESSPGTADRALRPPAEPLAGDVLALQMEDHYVRVHTAVGSELILMPLGQAIERMPVEGLRTHRSWWIARHAVVAIDGTPRAMRLHLSNGVIAPVARSAVAHLKAAGWIER
jgi:hypothetical protein